MDYPAVVVSYSSVWHHYYKGAGALASKFSGKYRCRVCDDPTPNPGLCWYCEGETLTQREDGGDCVTEILSRQWPIPGDPDFDDAA